MAFKKKKVDKKKKKGKKSSKDEWNFEGGQTVVDSEKPAKRKGFHNQAYDDKSKRLAIRSIVKKRKHQFESKMSKKVKFDNSTEEEKEEHLMNDREKNENKRKENRPPNPNPTVDRLNRLISASLSKNGVNLELSENSDSEEDEESVDNETADENETAEIEQNKEDFEVNDHEIDDNDLILENNEIMDNNQISKISKNFEFITESGSDGLKYDKQLITITKDKMSYLYKINGTKDEIYGAINENVELSKKPICTPFDIPGINKMFLSENGEDLTYFNELGQQILPFLLTYADGFIEGRKYKNEGFLLEPILFHLLNHVLNARSLVLKNNQKLKKINEKNRIKLALTDDEEKSKKQKSKNIKKQISEKRKEKDQIIEPTIDFLNEEEENEEILRDQGFTRPRVLILCPFRGTVVSILREIKAILGPNTSVSGWEKLEEEYGLNNDESDDDDEADKKKPSDWKSLFKQNVDDDFKMGIQINPGHGKGSGLRKGAYLRLFCDFFSSDIILASPLSLRLLIENSKDNIPKSVRNNKKTGEKSEEKTKERDNSMDFLSSLEMVFIHQAEVLMMQNWDHVDFVLKNTNLQPKDHRESTDFSRIRSYFLEENFSKFHRQLLMTSHFNSPELQAAFRKFGTSRAGQWRLRKFWGQHGCLPRIVSGAQTETSSTLKQIFQIVPTLQGLNALEQEEARFKYFKEQVLTKVLKLEQKHTLIVTPSYIDFVKIRNELIHQQANAAFISEYSRESEISRGRSRFFQGLKHILLYSGRSHFYRRFKIRGAKHVIFYSPPEFPIHYEEIVNNLGIENTNFGSEESSCLVLITRNDRFALERIVGKNRSKHMMDSSKNTFLFF